MEITLLIKVAGIGFLAAILCMILNKMKKEEIAELVTIAGIVIALLLIISEIGSIYEELQNVFRL